MKKNKLIYTFDSYYYCISCGKENVVPIKYRSCKNCYQNFKKGKPVSDYCLLCNNKKVTGKDFNLCRNCFDYVKNEEILLHFSKGVVD